MRHFLIGWQAGTEGGYSEVKASSAIDAFRQLRYLLSGFGASLEIVQVMETTA